eukprot:137502-Rhodomonas_salina.3
MSESEREEEERGRRGCYLVGSDGDSEEVLSSRLCDGQLCVVLRLRVQRRELPSETQQQATSGGGGGWSWAAAQRREGTVLFGDGEVNFFLVADAAAVHACGGRARAHNLLDLD